MKTAGTWQIGHGPAAQRLEDFAGDARQIRRGQQLHNLNAFFSRFYNRPGSLWQVSTALLRRVVSANQALNDLCAGSFAKWVVKRHAELGAAYAHHRGGCFDFEWRGAFGGFAGQRFQRAFTQTHQPGKPVGRPADRGIAHGVVPVGDDFCQAVGQYFDPAAVAQLNHSGAVGASFKRAAVDNRCARQRCIASKHHIAFSTDNFATRGLGLEQAQRDLQCLPRKDCIWVFQAIQFGNLGPGLGVDQHLAAKLGQVVRLADRVAEAGFRVRAGGCLRIHG